MRIKSLTLFALACLGVSLLALSPRAHAQAKPNIVYILADDMGLGDVRSYTANSPILTPHLDALSTGGMRFINAHSPSSVCTPTRYSILTGQYAWRTRLKSGVLGSYESSLIDANRQTVAEYLQGQGYDTAAFGKWHLGMDWQTTDGNAPKSDGSNVDHTKPFTGGPIDHGFDTYFGDGTINFPPYSFIEDDQVLGNPLSETVVGGDGINRTGPKDPNYQQVDSLPTVINRATQYLGNRTIETDPFFMYLPLSAPHSPIVPPNFIDPDGTRYNDNYERFIATVDWAVGEVTGALETQGIAEDTMIVFTADNGVAKRFATSDNISPGFIDGTALRGQKAHIYEGGHRVPLIVQWAGQVEAGAVSDQYVELNDLFATAVDMLGADAAAGAMGDSVSMLDILTGEGQTKRIAGVNHSFNGAFALRFFDEEGTEWKLIFGKGNGGFSDDSVYDPLIQITEQQYKRVQLYNMTQDVGEQVNLLADGVNGEEALLITEMQSLMQTIITSGESTELTSVPEPTSLMILGAASLMLCRRRAR